MDRHHGRAGTGGGRPAAQVAARLVRHRVVDPRVRGGGQRRCRPTWPARDRRRPPVGVLLASRHFPGAAEIYLMAVDPSVHRRGVGRALVEALEHDLAAERVRLLQVKTLGPSDPDRRLPADEAVLRGHGVRAARGDHRPVAGQPLPDHGQGTGLIALARWLPVRDHGELAVGGAEDADARAEGLAEQVVAQDGGRLAGRGDPAVARAGRAGRRTGRPASGRGSPTARSASAPCAARRPARARRPGGQGQARWSARRAAGSAPAAPARGPARAAAPRRPTSSPGGGPPCRSAPSGQAGPGRSCGPRSGLDGEVAEVRRPAEQDVVQAGHLGRQHGMLRHVGDQPGAACGGRAAAPAGRQGRCRPPSGSSRRSRGAWWSCPRRSGRSARPTRRSRR